MMQFTIIRRAVVGGPIFTPLEDHGPQSPAREMLVDLTGHTPKTFLQCGLGNPVSPCPFIFGNRH